MISSLPAANLVSLNRFVTMNHAFASGMLTMTNRSWGMTAENVCSWEKAYWELIIVHNLKAWYDKQSFDSWRVPILMNRHLSKERFDQTIERIRDVHCISRFSMSKRDLQELKMRNEAQLEVVSFLLDIFIHSPLSFSKNCNQSGLRDGPDDHSHLLFRLPHHLGDGSRHFVVQTTKRESHRVRDLVNGLSGQVCGSRILPLFVRSCAPLHTGDYWNVNTCKLRVVCARWKTQSHLGYSMLLSFKWSEFNLAFSANCR
jgi:hypothetical protein